MVRVAPPYKAFNAGEWSPWLDGQITNDRYPQSLRKLYNMYPMLQGPAICRSGTRFMLPLRRETERNWLAPFIFDEDESIVLDFSDLSLRFITDDGVITRAPTNITAVSGSTNMVVTSAGHGVIAPGEQVALSGFPASTNLNGRVPTVMSIAGANLTLNISKPSGSFSITGAQVARVYAITMPYEWEDLSKIRVLQDKDVMFIYCKGYRPYTLSRYDTYDWRLAEKVYTDGPYLPVNDGTTRIALSGTGGAIPIMTNNTTPSGTASATENNTDAFKAFDGDLSTFWAPDTTDQVGELQYEFAAPHVVKGYTIHIPPGSDDATGYNSSDPFALGYAPYAWTFEGWDGAAWIVLDQQTGFDAWTDNRSIYLAIKNAISVSKVRLKITSTRTVGEVKVRIALLTVYAKDATAQLTLTASSQVNINRDVGFLATDVGRLLRLQGEDAFWRDFKILTRVSPTVVTAELQGDPFPTARGGASWRLGYFSDTTGWPLCAEFFDDRLYEGWTAAYPNVVAGSVVGIYNSFRQTEPDGTVLDDNAVVFTLKGRQLAEIVWMVADERGLIIGTTWKPYILKPRGSDQALTARNAKAQPLLARGCFSVEPVQVDRQILYIPRGQRAVREIAYVFEADGFKSPSMSNFSAHLGANRFAGLAYAEEPHSIIYARRADGQMPCLSYNRDENVVGWALFEMADGGIIENFCVKPDPTTRQDSLWLTVKRTVNGQERRYIEKLQRPWDFGLTTNDAHFVDSGLRYDGPATSVLYGLWHLEGKEVDGLADGNPFPTKTVVNGSITLDVTAWAVVGLGYEAEAHCSRVEAGGAQGTVQGLMKRMYGVIVRLWSSGPGYIGRHIVKENRTVFERLELRETSQGLGTPYPLFTGDTPPQSGTGYDRDGIVAFKKDKHTALPFNVVAVFPDFENPQ